MRRRKKKQTQSIIRIERQQKLMHWNKMYAHVPTLELICTLRNNSYRQYWHHSSSIEIKKNKCRKFITYVKLSTLKSVNDCLRRICFFYRNLVKQSTKYHSYSKYFFSWIRTIYAINIQLLDTVAHVNWNIWIFI